MHMSYITELHKQCQYDIYRKKFDTQSIIRYHIICKNRFFVFKQQNTQKMQDTGNAAKKRRDNQTKQRIISVAQELFHANGFESASISQICKRVGISKHTFYYYFETKAELLVTCSGMEKPINKSELTRILLSEDKYFEQFWMLQKPKIDFALGCGSEILKNIQHIINERRLEKVKQDDEQREVEASIIRKAQNVGEVRNGADADSLVLASGVYHLGILTLWVSMNGSFDLKKAFRTGIEIFFDVHPDLRQGEDLYSLIRQTEKTPALPSHKKSKSKKE